MTFRSMFTYSIGITLTLSMQFALSDTMNTFPLPLIEAAKAYKDKGSDAFLPALIKKSRLQSTDKKSLQQASMVFRKIELLYGDYLGIELVHSVSISASTRTVYFILKYERGPLYGVVDIYSVNNHEIVTSSNVNTELHKIIPKNVVATFH